MSTARCLPPTSLLMRNASAQIYVHRCGSNNLIYDSIVIPQYEYEQHSMWVQDQQVNALLCCAPGSTRRTSARRSVTSCRRSTSTASWRTAGRSSAPWTAPSSTPSKSRAGATEPIGPATPGEHRIHLRYRNKKIELLVFFYFLHHYFLLFF